MQKIIYVDMDDVLCAFSKRHAEEIAQSPEIVYPQSQYGFFRGLDPIPGGIEAINTFQALEQFEVYILTAPSVLNPLCYTEKRLWVEDHFDFNMASRLIISPHKHLSKGDYLIDDNLSGKGQERFEGKLLHFGSEAYPNWERVMAYFKETYQL